MADTKISNLTLNLNPSAVDVFPIVNNNITKKIGLSDAFGPLTFSSTSNYIVLSVTDNISANGINLLNAYTTATTLTPNASALSSSNRTVIILPPATYNLGTSSLNLNTQYIDLVGFTRDANHVTITSSNSAATVVQTANNVRCIGLTVNNINNTTGVGWNFASNLNLAYCENIIFSSIKTTILSGFFKNCSSSNLKANGGGFGGYGGYIISGTFLNCTGTNTGLAGGGFVGLNGTASGIFTNCTGTNTQSLGGGFLGYGAPSASGTFTNCTGTNTGVNGGGFVGQSGNSAANGIFINCTGTNSGNYGGGFVGSRATVNGTFINCNGVNNTGSGAGGFIGSSGTISGTLINCTGTNNSGSNSAGFAGNNGKVSGTFINCIGNTFFIPSNTTSGAFINCSTSDANFPALTNSGDSTKPACYVNCLDGSGRLINGSA